MISVFIYIHMDNRYEFSDLKRILAPVLFAHESSSSNSLTCVSKKHR